MNKVKINSGLASIILIASLFTGLQSLLLVTVLLFIFTDINDKIQIIAIKVITFYVGITLFSLAWGLIYD